MKNDALETLDFKDQNIQLLLMMAATYGGNCGTAPVRHLGQDLAGQAITIGQDRYSITPTRMEVDGKKTLGVLVVKSCNHYTVGERKQERWFYPMEELGHIDFQVKGRKL